MRLTGNRTLKRAVFFVVFCIPIGWYLFLQLFGSNAFHLGKVVEIPSGCETFKAITIVCTEKKLNAGQTNHLDRIEQRVAGKEIAILTRPRDYFSCVNTSDKEVLLLDREGLWGSYMLTRDETDRLLTELDILLIQKPYGKNIDR